MGLGDGGGEGKGAVFCLGLIAEDLLLVGIFDGELDLKNLKGMFGVLEFESVAGGW